MPQDLSAVPWPIRTDRLSLRPAEPGDASAGWAYRRLPEVSDWLPRHPATEAEFAEMLADPTRLERTLVVEHDGAIIGDLYLHWRDAWTQAEVAEEGRLREAEIGWVLAPAYAGRGLATEAVRALLEVCFDRLACRRVVAVCFADNEPSWRLMERVGMRREAHTVADSLHRTRGWLDGYAYGLLAEEWRAAP